MSDEELSKKSEEKPKVKRKFAPINKPDVLARRRKVQEELDDLTKDHLDERELMHLVNMSVSIMKRALKSTSNLTTEKKISIAQSIVLKTINKEIIVTKEVGDNILSFIKEANRIDKESNGTTRIA